MQVEEQVKALSQSVEDLEIKYWVEHNLKNFLEKTNTLTLKMPDGTTESKVLDKSAIEHIIDYFKSDRAPDRLRKMSVEDAYVGAEKWTKALVKRNKGVFELDGDIEVVKELADGYALVKLVGENAYKREGSIMGHCVGGYYGRSGSADSSNIFSIRSPKNEPHCTMEIRGDRILQIKGKQNRPVLPKYINYVFEALEGLNIKVEGSNEDEFKNINYHYINKGTTAFLQKHLDSIPGWEIVETKIGTFFHQTPTAEDLKAE